MSQQLIMIRRKVTPYRTMVCESDFCFVLSPDLILQSRMPLLCNKTFVKLMIHLTQLPSAVITDYVPHQCSHYVYIQP